MCHASPMLGVSGTGLSCVSWLAKPNFQHPQQSQSLFRAFKKYIEIVTNTLDGVGHASERIQLTD